MKNKMFASLIEKPEATAQWWLFPMSLLVHAVVLASVFVAPLLSDSVNMPALKIVTVALISAPPPAPVQTAAKAKGGHRREAAKDKPESALKPAPRHPLLAISKIPDEIVPENMDDYGDPEGSEDGGRRAWGTVFD